MKSGMQNIANRRPQTSAITSIESFRWHLYRGQAHFYCGDHFTLRLTSDRVHLTRRLHYANIYNRKLQMYVPKEGGVILTRDVALFQLGFPDLNGDRTAPFKDQFASLAKQEGQGAKKRRKQIVRAILSKLAFRIDNYSRVKQQKLLCVEVRITGKL